MKIQVNDRVIDIAEGYIKVIDGRLKNLNTGRDEGVEGDIVEYSHGNKRYKGHVVGYTNYQLIQTEEYGPVVLEASAARNVSYTHINRITTTHQTH